MEAARHAELGCDDEERPEKAEGDARPAARRYLFAEERPDEEAGREGLQPRNQRGDARRQPVPDGPEDAAEIEAVQENARKKRVPPLHRPSRPSRPRQERDRGEDEDRERVAEDKEAQGLGIGSDEARHDEARRPDDDKDGGRQAAEELRGGHGVL